MTVHSGPSNWLLISLDQWRGDWLHQPWLQLPHLQRMAREGWDVRRYTSSPQCIPARASWLTGLTPGQLGVTANAHYTVPADAPSFVRDLRDQHGFHTVLVGKTHWTPHTKGVDLRDNLPLMRELGFEHVREIAGPRALAEVSCELTDRWQEADVMEAYRADLLDRYQDGCAHTVRPSVLPDVLYPDLWLTGVALEELARMPQDQPWLLWVNFPGPHEPFDVPASWRGHHGAIPAPQPRPQDAQELQRCAPEGSSWLASCNVGPMVCPKKRCRRFVGLRRSSASVGCPDRNVVKGDGRPQRQNQTAVSVCSDHGELLGDWGLLLKGCFLEGAMRSLFLHRPPGGRSRLRRLGNPRGGHMG